MNANAWLTSLVVVTPVTVTARWTSATCWAIIGFWGSGGPIGDINFDGTVQRH